MNEGETIFVVDDDPAVREGLDSLFRSMGYRVECFGSAEEFLARRQPDGPCCLILDIRMPGLNGMDLQKRLAEQGSTMPIIFLTGHGDIPMSVKALKTGAVDFLVKPFRERDLFEAVLRGLDRDRRRRAASAEAAALLRNFSSLTPREREVMDLVTRGLLNREIAEQLGIGIVMVKVHRGHVMRKMEAENLPELVRMASRLSALSSHQGRAAPGL